MLAMATTAGPSKDKIKVGSRSIVCQEADIRGDVTIGAGCVLHPKCTMFAYAGPIVMGDCCIVEETAVIVNRNKAPMVIGSYNLFETGCRIEAASIGSYNTFEPKSRVPSSIALKDYCVIGAGCVVLPELPAMPQEWEDIKRPAEIGAQSDRASPTEAPGSGASGIVPEQTVPPSPISGSQALQVPTDASACSPPSSSQPGPPNNATDPVDAAVATATPTAVLSSVGADSGIVNPPSFTEHLPSYTVVYGASAARRKWSGEGKGQQVALMHKHLAYLRETLPKFVDLKLIT